MFRSTYHGKKLVLAFDVGTTSSGISYRCLEVPPSVFEQDEEPEVRGVTRCGEHKQLGEILILFALGFQPTNTVTGRYPA